MLRLEQLRKAYGEVVAVDGLSLHARRGEILGLLGPNGAGKTTTLSMAVGLVKPDSGEVHVNDAGSPTNPQVRRHLGLAPQSLAIYDNLTAEENLLLFARVYGITGSAAERVAASLLERVNLADRRHHRVKGFSGGMKRRLNLAIALVHNPPLVLLDEPTAGVDPQSRSAILDMVLALKSEGRTVVYTTHYMEEAQRVCDRVAIMDHGRLLALGTVEELIASHGGTSVLTVTRRSAAGETSTRIETSDPVTELLSQTRRDATEGDPAGEKGDGGVVGVRIDRPSLETVFLHLTGRTLRD
jgi:ABC-2 type transport system ATP-binding protein